MSDGDPLGEMAVAPIERGMTVGLGTGRAASRAIRALGARDGRERLGLRCVATSERSAELARSLGLRVEPMETTASIDYLFDGADEVDPALRMIKGAGGAMTREKIAARAARHRVYLVDRSKLVTRLGERFRVPVEVMAYALASASRSLGDAGLRGDVRMGEDGARYMTDNGNLVLDVALPEGRDPGEVDRLLDGTPGVVGHGLFLVEADEVLVEGEQGGAVDRRVR